MRKIPTLMASQHPDNVGAPHWSDSPFVSTYAEPEDCYRSFKDLGCDEYMWDWEGKLVDEAVFDRLVRRYNKFFSEQQLGKDVFLTYRIPNVSHEPGYRLARAYMGMLSAAEFAKEIGMHSPPVFEVILPMTESVHDLMHVQKTFHRTAQLKAQVFEEQSIDLPQVSVIPLFEGVDNLITAHETVRGYVEEYTQYHGQKPEYLRPFVARSDPALNSGIVATTLAIKIALWRFSELSDELGIPLPTIIGPGSLPFRGHLAPHNVEHFSNEYAGVRTVLLQSSFRFDWQQDEVKKAIAILKQRLPEKHAQPIPDEDMPSLVQAIRYFEEGYRSLMEPIADDINQIAQYVPSRRERMLHIGLLGYSRSIGDKKLPRAIKFTSSLYSIGIPPELIGLGHGLKHATEHGLFELVERYYRNFEHDIKTAGYHFNRENLHFLASRSEAWQAIKDDIEQAEKLLGMEFGPRTLDHYIHRNSVSNVYFLWQEGKDLTKEIEWAARSRHSLG